ncbi:unnamed protein product [Microthlaspi erraticum]|uniref:SCP domain-containing protein n=1 Tax=Microthlaspi erraticum TaxID=1685480 RepID=A0A6D2HGQ8_9BRAS|nr:unnamed protein product [Microthlaspi erraticum]
MEPKILILIIIVIITTPLPCLSFQTSSGKTPPPTSSQYKTPVRNTVQQQFLRPHNTLRAKLRLPPLKWSNNLALYATRWARTRLGDCKLVHSGGPYGENLFWGSGKGWTPRDAVVAWASEKNHYDRRTYRCMNGDCLHYTQLVWKKSLRIGCEINFCKSGGGTFIICNYDPPGNIVGQPPF